MYRNQITGQYEPTQFKSGEIVFALTSEQVVWPARIFRITPDKDIKIRYYIIGGIATVKSQQLWPFNNGTIERFVNEESPLLFLKAIQNAKKSLSKNFKKNNYIQQSNQQIGFLNTSIEQKYKNKFQDIGERFKQTRLCKRVGLFIIQQADSKLQYSNEGLTFLGNTARKINNQKNNQKMQLPKACVRRKRQIDVLNTEQNNRGKRTTRLQLKQQEKIRKRQQKQDQRKRLALKNAMDKVQEYTMEFISLASQLDELRNTIQNSKIEQFERKQINKQNELQTEIEDQTIIHQTNQSTQQKQIMYGPPNIFDLSTNGSCPSCYCE